MPAGVLGMGTWCPAPVSWASRCCPKRSAGGRRWERGAVGQPLAAQGFWHKGGYRGHVGVEPCPPLPTGGPWLLWPVPCKPPLMPFPAAPGTRSTGPSPAPPGGLGDNLPLGLLGEPSASPSHSLECLDCASLMGREFLSGKLFKGLSSMRSTGHWRVRFWLEVSGRASVAILSVCHLCLW